MQPADGDARDGHRTRTHARALAGRVHVAAGRVTLVTGSPDPLRLMARLREWKHPPVDGATPCELGFPPEAVATVTASGLHTRARSVRRWRSAVEQELGGRRLYPARRKELVAQLAELDTLSERVADLHRLLAEPGADVRPLRLTAAGKPNSPPRRPSSGAGSRCPPSIGSPG